MLETPGAIAELGSFSMIPEIRGRLYVLVPSEFYGSRSFINRGPLSLIGKHHSLAVIYYDPQNVSELIRRIGYPLMLHKYARKFSKYDPSASLSRSEEPTHEVLERIRETFLPRYVLANVAILGEPHFTELRANTLLLGDDLNTSLKYLYSQNAVKKESGRYRLLSSFGHELLEDFDTGSLSRKRSELVASQ